MLPINAIHHAALFARYLEENTAVIHQVLRQYQSKEVIDDEIQRSLDTLQNLAEIGKYFTVLPLSQKTAAFLPLNLPLYSFVLFAAIPSYQSVSLFIRAPQKLQSVFEELFSALSFGRHYPNIHLFKGSREGFLSEHCKGASVVLFTGKYENFLRVRKSCNKKTLILYNGVGHNPLVITPSANLDLAVAKTLQVKLFNNGQDCAGPDNILVHGSIIDEYLMRLIKSLSQVQCDTTYQDDATIVGPLFETDSLLGVAGLISSMRDKGATILYGGQFDLQHNVMLPCVMRTSLHQLRNFTELYSPLILVTEYDHDHDLGLYFDGPNAEYEGKAMYVSLFGESDYVQGVTGSIILKNRTIHDIERGVEEYGGYSPGASSVSFQDVHIAKPLLIPREIYNFLSLLNGQHLLASAVAGQGDLVRKLISASFQGAVANIFGTELEFAFIFGSFASNRDKRHSDLDTFVCVHEKRPEQIERYLTWLFSMHEMFGRIPDFKYPTEIVLLSELQSAVVQLSTLELSTTMNAAQKYDVMVWCHSLSQPWIGAVNPERIPPQWKDAFPTNSNRILRSFLISIEQAVSSGSDISQLKPELYEIPRDEPGLSNYIDNLKGRGLVNVLKMIPFEEIPVHIDVVMNLVATREFMGKSLFAVNSTTHLHNPYFRFGVVAD